MLIFVQLAEGQIHYTTDVWSDKQLVSYMAVTAHYIIKQDDGRRVLRSRLCAFQHLVGSHTGVNLGQEFVKILDDLDVLGRVSLSHLATHILGLADIMPSKVGVYYA